jgi:hypothetical protein
MNDPEALRKFLAESEELEQLREQTEIIYEKDFLGEHAVGKTFAENGLPGDLGYCIGRCKTENRVRFAVVGHWDGSKRGFCQSCALELAQYGMHQHAQRRRAEREHKRNNQTMSIPGGRRRRRR